MTTENSGWVPGDPVHPEQGLQARGHCGPCLVAWTADEDRCPECGELSTEALREQLRTDQETYEIQAVATYQQAQPRTPFAIHFDGTWESVNAWLSWLGHDEDGDDTSGGPAVGLQDGRLVLEFADDGERYVIEPGGWLINVSHGEWRPGVMLAPGFPSDVGPADGSAPADGGAR